jgi:hypothetical protein
MTNSDKFLVTYKIVSAKPTNYTTSVKYFLL